jgi:hypothetical protein
MDIIEIMAKVDTPYVLLDSQNGILKIKGRSYPENPQAFYAPIFQWIRKNADNGISKLEVSFFLEYFNTTSFKIIFDMLFELESVETTYGIDIQILWYYDAFSLDVKEAGSDLSELINLPFNISECTF